MAQEPRNDYEDSQITKELDTKYKCVIATYNTKYKGDDVKPDLNVGGFKYLKMLAELLNSLGIKKQFFIAYVIRMHHSYLHKILIFHMYRND